MASIVEWQSLKMQEYRYSDPCRSFTLLGHCSGLYRPVRYEKPVPAGDYDHALHVDHPGAPSFLAQYITEETPPRLGGKPKQTAGPDNPL